MIRYKSLVPLSISIGTVRRADRYLPSGPYQAIARRKERDHVTPRVPVLRPAMHQHDRLTLAGQRDVDPQASGIDETMLDARHARHRAGRCCVHAGVHSAARTASSPRDPAAPCDSAAAARAFRR
jgi:hypothetical protein